MYRKVKIEFEKLKLQFKEWHRILVPIFRGIDFLSALPKGFRKSKSSKTYNDTLDEVILAAPSSLFDQWNKYENHIFTALNADRGIRRGVLLNAGAGRKITPIEVPFFNSFAKIYLLEPDSERRSALAQNTLGSGTILISNRIEDLDTSEIDPADFVLCKYVLQHIHTHMLPNAMERLKSAVATNGVIGIFSASSADNSYFFLSHSNDSAPVIPLDLRPDSRNHITEAQFNRLISEPQDFPFIATHHISHKTLLDYFAGWNPTLEVTSFDAVFLRARRPGKSITHGKTNRGNVSVSVFHEKKN